MKPPLVLDARGDLLFFESPQSLAGYVEVIDVRNGEYEGVYDSDGRRYKLVVRHRHVPLVGRFGVQADGVEIEPDEQGLRVNELRSLLLRYLGESSSMDPDVSVSGLLDRAIAQAGIH